MTGPDPFPHDEPDRERFRALLQDAVTDVQPSPALDRIRARTKVIPMRRIRPWLFVAAGAIAATAATAATVVAVSLAGGGSPQADPSPGPAATSTATSSDEPSTPESTPSEPTPSRTPPETPSTGPGPDGKAVAVPVYYVGGTPVGPRLFREFHRMEVTSPGAAQDAAIVEAVTRPPLDPDYYSPWAAQGVTVGGLHFDGVGSDGVISIDLGSGVDLRARPTGMTATEARLAVQQLVYTAQAALQVRAPVEFFVEGRSIETLWGVPVADGVDNEDPCRFRRRSG